MSLKTVCRHVFHAKCGHKWILAENSCPICRTVLSNFGVREFWFSEVKLNGIGAVGKELELEIVGEEVVGAGKKSGLAGILRSLGL